MINGEYSRGDIVYIDKSLSNIETGAEIHTGRPGIVISNDKLNATSPVITVVYLTTKPKQDADTHVKINSTRRESTAICEQISTVSKDRINNYCGKCCAEELQKINVAIQKALDINSVTTAMPCSNLFDKEQITLINNELNIYKILYNNLLEKVTKQ